MEALGVLDGLDELLLRVLEALVLGEQQVVEARVRGGEPVLVGVRVRVRVGVGVRVTVRVSPTLGSHP